MFAQARGHFGNLAACGRCPLESYVVQFRVQWNRKLGDHGEQDPEQKRARMKHMFLLRPQPFVTTLCAPCATYLISANLFK